MIVVRKCERLLKKVRERVVTKELPNGIDVGI